MLQADIHRSGTSIRGVDRSDQHSLVALMYSRFAVDVPFSDARIRQLRITRERDRLVIAFDASLFHHDWSGTIEYRYRTSQAVDKNKWIHDLTQT